MSCLTKTKSLLLLSLLGLAVLSSHRLSPRKHFINIGISTSVETKEDAIEPQPPLPICSGDSYHIGKWEKKEHEFIAHNSSGDAFDSCPWNEHRNCMHEESQQPFGKHRIIKSMQWEWKPSTCQLHPFNHTRLSKTLQEQNRRIVYLGDSLNGDMAISMRCMMAQTQMGEDDEDEHQHPDENITSLVTEIRNDYLGCPLKTDAAYGTSKYCSNRTEVVEVWKGLVQSHGIRNHDILVINTGAHWHGRPENAATAFLNIANAIAEVFQGKVIVRTTVVGHKGCEKFKDIIPAAATVTATAGTVASTNKTDHVMPYNWAQFGTLNDLIAKAVEESNLTNYQILYVDMFEQRPDGHYQGAIGGPMDCLHYCVPGPINWWNKLLYHIIYDTIFLTSTKH